MIAYTSVSAGNARAVPLRLSRPEFELVVRCARVELSEEDARRVQALAAEPLDWNLVVSVASWHRLSALVYYHLSHLCPEAPPPAPATLLRSAGQMAALGGLARTAELARLLRLLAARGIPAQVLKGPVLASGLYGNLSLRPFKDLDVLVRRADIARCKEVLLQDGYVVKEEMTAEEEDVFIERKYAYSLIRTVNGAAVEVELHWALTHDAFSFSLPDASLWEAPYPVRVGGHTFHTLRPEENLLFLCVHGAKHEWCQLLLVCDVAEFLRAHPDLDWARLFVLAGQTRTRRMLLLGLYLASELLGAPVPEEQMRLARTDRRVQALAATVESWLFEYVDQPLSQGEMIRFHVLIREHLRDVFMLRMEHIHLLFKPSEKDRVLLSLPRHLSFVYYLVRPFRFLFSLSKGR